MINETKSMEWIRRAAEYRVLVGKRDSLGQALAAPEQARLEELERLFGRDANRRRMPWTQREQLRTPVCLMVQFGDAIGMVRDLSGDGMYVQSTRPLRLGARAVMRVNAAMQRGLDGEPFDPFDYVEPLAVDEWRFTVEVVRVDGEGMGLRFVGIPVQLRISQRAAAVPPVRNAA